MDFARARDFMVESQVRPSDVTDLRILHAMRTLPRERFVPAAKRTIAYGDLEVEVADGRTLMRPRDLGKLILMKPMPLSTTTADGLVAAVGRFMTVAQACRQAVRERPASAAGTEPPAMSESHTLLRA